jgi:hypothetical protein
MSPRFQLSQANSSRLSQTAIATKPKPRCSKFNALHDRIKTGCAFAVYEVIEIPIQIPRFLDLEYFSSFQVKEKA